MKRQKPTMPGACANALSILTIDPDVAAGGEVKNRGIIVQKQTGRPVQFEITEQTRIAIRNLMSRHYLRSSDFFWATRPRIVIILAGGDKSSQERDIKAAKRVWDEWKEQNR